MKPSLLWLRLFLSAAFGGAADGVLIGLGGSAGVSAVTHSAVSVPAVLATIAVNVLVDTARFVKANPDPWGPAPGLPPSPSSPTP
jgi:hypothetical protein